MFFILILCLSFIMRIVFTPILKMFDDFDYLWEDNKRK